LAYADNLSYNTGFGPTSLPQSIMNDSNKAAQDGVDSNNVLASVNLELRRLEKRDAELWLIVTATGVLAAAGLLAVLLPAAFLKSGSLHLEITVSKELACGLFVMLALTNSYIVARRIEFRKLRQKVISTAMQNELIRLQSFTDPLTEIYNRRSLDELASRFIGQARRLGKPLTFLLIDVDRFKQVNTQFGHLTGDFVLTEIATLLKNSIRVARVSQCFEGGNSALPKGCRHFPTGSASPLRVAYSEFNSRTNLAYSSVAFFSSSPTWFTSRASAFLSASTALCTRFSAALTSSMVDMADP